MRNSNLALDESTTPRNFLDYFQIDEDAIYETTRQSNHHPRNNNPKHNKNIHSKTSKKIAPRKLSKIETILLIVIISFSIRCLLDSYISDYYFPLTSIIFTRVIRWILFSIITLLHAINVIRVRARRRFIDVLKYSLQTPFVSIMLYTYADFNISTLVPSLVMILLFVYRWTAIFEDLLLKTYNIKPKRNQSIKSAKRKAKAKIYSKHFHKLAWLCGISLIIFPIIFTLFPPVRSYRGTAASAKPATYTTTPDTDLIALIEDHKDELIVLQSDKFYDASTKEKLNALQILLNCETSYFQIESAKLKMDDRKILANGYYDPKDKTVYISSKQLDNEEMSDIIMTILHEGRHHYQHCAVHFAEENNIDLSEPIYTDIKLWKENMEDYFVYEGSEQTEDDYLEYLVQPIEADAREYSYFLSVKIKSLIESWD